MTPFNRRPLRIVLLVLAIAVAWGPVRQWLTPPPTLDLEPHAAELRSLMPVPLERICLWLNDLEGRLASRDWRVRAHLVRVEPDGVFVVAGAVEESIDEFGAYAAPWPAVVAALQGNPPQPVIVEGRYQGVSLTHHLAPALPEQNVHLLINVARPSHAANNFGAFRIFFALCLAVGTVVRR